MKNRIEMFKGGSWDDVNKKRLKYEEENCWVVPLSVSAACDQYGLLSLWVVYQVL